MTDPRSQAMQAIATTNRRRWIIAILVGGSLLAMGSVLGNGFSAFDDEHTIWENDRLNPPRWSGNDSIASYWGEWRKGHLGLYIPVTYTVWGILAHVTYVETADEMGNHLDARAFHAASLLLHVASVLLVYFIVRHILRRKTDKSPVAIEWGAALGALIFATHPLQVESVAWTSGMKDLLCASFSLATIACYLKMTGRRAVLWYVLGTICLALGLLSKPAAMVTPAIVLVIEWLGCGIASDKGWRALLSRLLPWVAMCAVVGWIAKTVQPGTGVESVALWQRPMLAGGSLAFYLWKLVWPTNLVFDYGWRPPLLVQQRWFYGMALIPLLIAVALWVGRRRWKVLIAAAAIFVIGLGPVLGLVRFTYQFYSTVADHYVYLSMLGIALAVAWCIVHVPVHRLQAVLVGTGAVAALLAVLSLIQMSRWRDIPTCLQRTLAVTPDSALGRTNYGQYLMIQGNVPAAVKEFRRAVEINPRNAIGWDNLVQVEARSGAYEQMMHDFHEYRRARTLNQELPVTPTTANEYLNASLGFAEKRIWGAAERFIVEALRVEPANATAAEALRRIRSARAPATTRATTLPTP